MTLKTKFLSISPNKLKNYPNIGVIGGGAAGFFTAINIKGKHPEKSVLIIEKDKNLLKNVAIF